MSELKKKARENIHLSNNCTLFYSSVDKWGRAKEGIGIILKRDQNNRVVIYNAVNSRIIKEQLLNCWIQGN